MEPTGADTQLILAALAEGFTGLNRRADDAQGRLVEVGRHLGAHDKRLDDVYQLVVTVKEAVEARLDAHDQRFDDLHVLIVTVKEAAELQSARIDALTNRVEQLDTRLTGRIDTLERRMERGFARVDERFARVDERFARVDERFVCVDQRFDVLITEMRAGFAEIGRTRRRGPKRED